MKSKESENVEEYLEVIYRLVEKGEKPTTTQIAKLLNVSAPSVSEMLKKLGDRGYLNYEPYKGVVLTKKGKKIGKTVLRRHRIIEKFLEKIGLSKNKIHDEACKLEHAVSKELEEVIEKEISSPTYRKGVIALVDLKQGQSAEMVSVDTGQRAKKRLEDLGLTPGASISVVRSAPFGGPIEILIRGSKLAIGRGMARKIYVKVDE
ncbi:MAG: metal-dependent transcriptional regulator [Candidatus Aenigmarchaeota archaeon]|nr:metal-dependent transcriptional regulator [Candidatus Aenigmarchaeota archaeon]